MRRLARSSALKYADRINSSLGDASVASCLCALYCGQHLCPRRDLLAPEARVSGLGHANPARRGEVRSLVSRRMPYTGASLSVNITGRGGSSNICRSPGPATSLSAKRFRARRVAIRSKARGDNNPEPAIWSRRHRRPLLRQQWAPLTLRACGAGSARGRSESGSRARSTREPEPRGRAGRRAHRPTARRRGACRDECSILSPGPTREPGPDRPRAIVEIRNYRVVSCIQPWRLNPEQGEQIIQAPRRSQHPSSRGHICWDRPVGGSSWPEERRKGSEGLLRVHASPATPSAPIPSTSHQACGEFASKIRTNSAQQRSPLLTSLDTTR